MFTVKVHLLSSSGEVREVDIPEENPNLGVTLDEVFYFGQNDTQLRPHPSVSVGDVVEYKGYHLVTSTGFKKITGEEFLERRAQPAVDNVLSAYGLNSQRMYVPKVKLSKGKQKEE